MEHEDQSTLNELVNRAQAMTYLTMDANLQETAISELDRVSGILAQTKQELLSSGDPSAADNVLATELFVDSLRRELRMWLQLKKEEYDNAWDDLVMAQRTLAEACQVACQQGLPQDHLIASRARLGSLEQCVFPPQLFLSAGARVDSFRCSVCGRNYDECEEHIAGQAYNGELCRLLTEGPLRADHIALVPNPEDKRCRVTDMAVDGFLRNAMTGRRGGEAQDGLAKVILMVADDVETSRVRPPEDEGQ